jgi:hypothetical protein
MMKVTFYPIMIRLEEQKTNLGAEYGHMEIWLAN